jgi:hypothetical protein
VSIQSHGQSIILILAKRSNNGAEAFGFIIQFERVVLHGDVNFGEEFIARALV